MNLLKSMALFLWMLGSSAYLCVFYLQLQKHKHQKRKTQKHLTRKKPSAGQKSIKQCTHEEKTQLLEEWEDLIWEYSDIKDL